MIANYGVEATRNKIAAADPFEQAEDDDAFGSGWNRALKPYANYRTVPTSSWFPTG